jgi:hypothetical protein
MTTQPTVGAEEVPNVIGAAPPGTDEVTYLAAHKSYREEMRVRKLDIVHVREDLDCVAKPRRWVQTIAAIIAGVAVTAGASLITALNSTPEAPYTVRFSFGAVCAAALIVSIVLYCIDHGDHNREQVSLEKVMGRVDELIVMFDKAEN